MGRFGNQSGRIALSVIAGVAIAVCVAAASGTSVAQAPVFRTETKLVRMIVSVKDNKGQLIGNLEKGDFKITDTGVEQQITVFEHHTEVPLSISLLIDISGSTGKDLSYETESVQKFLKALLREGNQQDAVSLYAFNDDVTMLTSFTRNQAKLDANLARLSGTAGTSLYDAVYLAAKPLEPREGRHVMVVVTDGGDTTSKQKFADALKAAHLAEATVYSILVVPIVNDAGRNTGGEHALETISTSTGGRVFSPSLGKALDKVFADILRDLRTQYLLAYPARNLPADAPAFHPVKVEITRPDLRESLHVSTRSGYYEDTAKR